MVHTKRSGTFGPSRPHFLNPESGATFPHWLPSSDKFHIKQPTVVCQNCRGLAPINHAVGSSKQRYGEAYGLVSSSTAALLPPKFLRITVPTTKTASGLTVAPSSASSTLGKKSLLRQTVNTVLKYGTPVFPKSFGFFFTLHHVVQHLSVHMLPLCFHARTMMQCGALCVSRLTI